MHRELLPALAGIFGRLRARCRYSCGSWPSWASLDLLGLD